jgi:putative oxidoreductase
MNLLTETNTRLLNICVLLLRVTLGSILFVAGAGKVMGWFDGKGLAMTIANLTTKLGIPESLAYLSCYTEFIGGALIILGLLSRPAALAVFVNMLVATLVTLPKGFFGQGGAAYPFSLMVTALVILLAGPMAYSLDASIGIRDTIHELRVMRGGLWAKKQLSH